MCDYLEITLMTIHKVIITPTTPLKPSFGVHHADSGSSLMSVVSCLTRKTYQVLLLRMWLAQSASPDPRRTATQDVMLCPTRTVGLKPNSDKGDAPTDLTVPSSSRTRRRLRSSNACEKQACTGKILRACTSPRHIPVQMSCTCDNPHGSGEQQW